MIENSFYFTIQVNFVLFIFLLLSVTVSGAQECFTKFLNLLYKNSLNFLEGLVVCCDSLILFYITLHEFPEIILLWFNAVKLQKRNKRRKFLQSKVLFVFGVLLVPFWNIRNFLRVDYFYFWIWESYFLKYKRNIRQYKKAPFLKIWESGLQYLIQIIETKSFSRKIYRNSEIVHFSEINQASSPYSKLQYIRKEARP